LPDNFLKIIRRAARVEQLDIGQNDIPYFPGRNLATLTGPSQQEPRDAAANGA